MCGTRDFMIFRMNKSADKSWEISWENKWLKIGDTYFNSHETIGHTPRVNKTGGGIVEKQSDCPPATHRWCDGDFDIALQVEHYTVLRLVELLEFWDHLFDVHHRDQLATENQFPYWCRDKTADWGKIHAQIFSYQWIWHCYTTYWNKAFPTNTNVH